VYWLLTENYVLNANILVFMLIHTELFSNVSGVGLGLIHCGLGLEKIFGPRPRPWPHAQLASLTSLATDGDRLLWYMTRYTTVDTMLEIAEQKQVTK